MSTVGEVIDRVLRDFLASPEDQPTRFELASTVDADDDSLSYDPAFLAPEEADLLGPGTLIEFSDGEQALVGGVDEEANELSGLMRGVNGTTAGSHAAGTLVTISPDWARKTIFDAVADAVVELWPDLFYLTQTAPFSVSSTPSEVAATVAQPLYFWGRWGSTGTYDQYPVQYMANFPASSTGQAVMVQAPSGTSGYLVYRSKFARPTAESDSLSALGVAAEWERLVIISAVAYLITGKDIDAATSESLTQQLAAQGFPVASGARLRNALIDYRRELVRQAKKALRTSSPTLVVEHTAVL